MGHDNNVAANIARHANTQQLTLTELARRTNGAISAERIRQCITGRRSFLIPEIQAIATALGVDPSDLTLDGAA